jgi:thiol-disulfide isomerase/thioredoxin
MLYYLEAFDFDVNKKQLLPSLLPEFKDKLFLIMAKADWCPHCVHATPEFEKTDQLLANNRDIVLCYVNITGETDEEKKSKDIVGKFFDGFRGFPGFYAFMNGKQVGTHNGPREGDAFAKFATSLTQ